MSWSNNNNISSETSFTILGIAKRASHTYSSNLPTLITWGRDGWGLILGTKLEKNVAGDSLAIPPSTDEVLEQSYLSDKKEVKCSSGYVYISWASKRSTTFQNTKKKLLQIKVKPLNRYLKRVIPQRRHGPWPSQGLYLTQRKEHPKAQRVEANTMHPSSTETTK